MRGPLMIMRGKPGARYLDVAASMGAVTLMDGFTDAIDDVAYTNNNDWIVADGTDDYGHAALQSSGDGQCLYRDKAAIVSGSYTLVGATSLVGGNVSDFSRLATFGPSGGDGFIGRAAARTSPPNPRETFTPDPGNWHWFAYTVDHSVAVEVSRLYRDGVPLYGPWAADNVAPLTFNSVTFGGTTQARNIGQFSACAVFDSALTPEQISDLYAAYQRGL